MTKSEILLVVKKSIDRFQSRDFILNGRHIGAHRLPVNIWPEVVFMIKKMVLYAICSCGTRSGRDKGINMARIPSIIHYYSTRRSTETFHDRVCSKHFISGKAVKLWDRYDPDLVRSLEMWFCQKASSQSWSCHQVRRKSQRSLCETSCWWTWKAAMGRNRVQKQIIDEPGVKVIDISFDFESVVGTKLSNTGFVLHLLRSK